MVVNGHYPGEGRRTDLNDCGQPVHQVLMDYQSRINGGDGWLRYFTFKPSENKIYAYTYSPKLSQFESRRGQPVRPRLQPDDAVPGHLDE